jgi:cell division protein FtsB
MSYGAMPSWKQKEEIAIKDSFHRREENRLNLEIQSLKKENQLLKERMKELEAEINDLRRYKLDYFKKVKL